MLAIVYVGIVLIILGGVVLALSASMGSPDYQTTCYNPPLRLLELKRFGGCLVAAGIIFCLVGIVLTGWL